MSSREHTSTPDYIIHPFDLIQDRLGVGLAFHILNATDQDIELARIGFLDLAELLYRGHLLLGANDAGNIPRAAEEERGEQLGNFAMTAKDKDMMRSHWHDDSSGPN